MRRTALAIAMAAGIMVPTVSTATVAWATPATKPAVSQKANPTPKSSKPAKATKPAKSVKASFAANGSVTAVDVDAHTVTIVVKGGTKDVKGRTVRILLPSSARIVLDDAPATAADIEAGFRITVTGTRLGNLYTASKVQASSPEPTVSPTPTDPAEPPTGDPTEQPTA
jgi:hypothetical protein